MKSRSYSFAGRDTAQLVSLLQGSCVVDCRCLQRGGGRQTGFDQQLQLLMQREARWAIRLGRIRARQQWNARAVQDAGQILVLLKLLAAKGAIGPGQPLLLSVLVPRVP